MSKLKVNELDTRSGTTITVAAGKTLAGTDIIGSTQIAANAVDTSEIAAGAVEEAKIDDNAVTLAKMAGLVRGKIIVGDASGDPSALTVGTADQVLTSDGTDATWSTLNTGTSWQAVTTGAALTAVAGNGYPINTTAQACTVTLPATASVGDTIEFVDYAGTWDTNNVTLDPQSLKMKGATTDLTLSHERQGLRIVYVDVTQGWVATTGVNEVPPAMSSFSATGGTITTYGIYTVHTFLTSSNFVCSGSGPVDVMLVGGGGGGGTGGQGGGAGGGRYDYNDSIYCFWNQCHSYRGWWCCWR